MNEEFNKFLEEVKTEQPKGLDDLIKQDELPTPEKVEEIPEKDEPRKNRHHRRLEQQLEREREMRIASEARAQALLEMNAGKVSEVDPILTQLYGNEERGKEAALLHQKLLENTFNRAKDEALKEVELRQAEREQEVRQFESYIDTELEALEDEHNVDLTSNAPAARKARNEMLELLERISPKDDNGNITEYADMSGVYEMYQLKRDKGGASERQKEVASRSMAKGESSPVPEKKPTPGFDGWRKDFGF